MTNQNNTTVNISPVAASNIKVAQFILSANSTEESFEYFTDDIVLEFPYAPSLNMPDRFEGKDFATTYLRQMLTQLKGLKLHSIRSYAVEGEPDRRSFLLVVWQHWYRGMPIKPKYWLNKDGIQ
ncbi:hypothetical protein [Cytobacillus sp. IB215316]|uniref:hypothetical protein n=1 Tax=Cytobacillus sp. IB215316 TaxID=3097354 RepID=UPI002A0DEC68|nr:hypothetical protein [Cytobacillus sp. IB215316]MDX8362991.1 hypothetical protein [Cytobacillus sp. IB215316]